MNKVLVITVLSAGLAGLSGCEVEKTEDGEMPSVDVDGSAGQLPQYDVEVRQTQQGRLPDVDVDVDGGKLPEYKVEGPEVTIGTQEKTVEVPTDVDIQTEEKSITVPDIDVDLPGDDDESQDQ